jgi:hypothetical protein
MTIDRPTTPPAWAESVLQMILRPDDRDSVSGDLLEEYRESIVPARGRKAYRWYVRQVAWYVLRATWAWGALVAAICLWRYLIDTLAPIHYTPGVVALRSAIMSWALIATFISGAAWHAWRTGHPVGAVFLTLVTAYVGAVIAMAGTAVLFALRHDPATIAAIDASGGRGELWAIPLVLQPVIAIVLGSVGAVAGYLARVVYDGSSANTKSA